MAIARGAADYLAQILALLPPGPAWNESQLPGLPALLAGLSPVFAGIDERAGNLLDEMHAGTVYELVPAWEAVMGLPDACMGVAPSYSERVLSVRARLLATGRQTPAYFAGLASQQGFYAPRVIEYRAPRFGRSLFGRARFGTWASQYMWALHAGFPAGSEPPGQALDCLISRYAPAHTVATIKYKEVE